MTEMLRSLRRRVHTLAAAMPPGLREAVLLGAIAIAASGCTSWVKPGATEAERQATCARCEAVSQMQAPPQTYQALISPARSTPRERRCNTDSRGRENCTTSGGDYRPAVYATRDENEAPRRAIFRDCMFSFGWRPE